MAHNDCSYVNVPTQNDEQIKDYIRMRDDHKTALKKIKQQISSFCLRHGYKFPGRSNWTIAHLKWLYGLELETLNREILNEYLQTYDYHVDRIERFDNRINELASMDNYEEQVKR